MNPSFADPLALAYHELRAPLGLVVTAARSAADEAPDEHTRQRCEIIVRAAERMLRTATRVLDLEHASDAPTAFAPAEVLDDVVVTLRGLDVAVSLHASAASRAARVDGPRETFESLVQSLLSNALDHGLPGSCIGVEMRATPDAVTVDVLNQIDPFDHHVGRGLGSHLTDDLAAELGAAVTTASAGDRFRARVVIPACAA